MYWEFIIRSLWKRNKIMKLYTLWSYLLNINGKSFTKWPLPPSGDRAARHWPSRSTPVPQLPMMVRVTDTGRWGANVSRRTRHAEPQPKPRLTPPSRAAHVLGGEGTSHTTRWWGLAPAAGDQAVSDDSVPLPHPPRGGHWGHHPPLPAWRDGTQGPPPAASLLPGRVNI